MIVISEYIYNNLELEEMINILTNKRKEYNEKYGADIKDKVYIEAEVEYINKLLNKKKVVKINHAPVSYHIRKREIASKNRFVVNRINRVIMIMEKDIKNFVINTYMKMRIPMVWRKFFIKISKNAEFLDDYCNNTQSKLHRAYRQWYLYNRGRLGVIIPHNDYPHDWIIHV